MQFLAKAKEVSIKLTDRLKAKRLPSRQPNIFKAATPLKQQKLMKWSGLMAIVQIAIFRTNENKKGDWGTPQQAVFAPR